MTRRVWAGLALGVVVALGAVLAVLLHRNGHTQGDDFALYLRQARSVFDGDTSQVVADNRYSVVNSGGAFSPIAYPWGLPILLSPFVRSWGLDYDRLKLVIVACFCVWLVLIHGVVRRRIGTIAAIAITLTVATVPLLLAHTDSILSEFLAAAAVGAIIWWLDRIRLGTGRVDARSLITARRRDLVVLGLLIALAFNVRRELLVLVAAIGLVQVVELVAAGIARRRAGQPVLAPAWVPWRELVTPFVTFGTAVAVFQLALPSMLLPDNADSGPKYIVDRLEEYPRFLSEQMGLFPHMGIGVAALVLVAVGIVVGICQRPGLDGPLASVALFSVLAVSTHFRFVGRYYFQVVPWVLYFGTVGVMALVGWIRLVWPSPWAKRVVLGVGLVPLLVLLGVHANKLPSRVDAARRFDDAGLQQVGPTHPGYAPVYAAVSMLTDPDDVILYFRARTMTLLTDRRSIQTTNLDRGEHTADYFAMQRLSDFYEPPIDELEAIKRGYEKVWEDDNWILWDMHPQ